MVDALDGLESEIVTLDDVNVAANTFGTKKDARGEKRHNNTIKSKGRADFLKNRRCFFIRNLILSFK